jgi:hypothetical protein
MVTKYKTQSIEIYNNDFKITEFNINDDITELILYLFGNINLNDFLDFSNFICLKKINIINRTLPSNSIKLKYAKKLYEEPIDYILNINLISINKIKCIRLQISHITNLPLNLEYLNCSDNKIKEIKYLPNTLKVLKLSNCYLDSNKIKLIDFYLPELEVLKLNSNNLDNNNIIEFIPYKNKLKVFECTNNNLVNFVVILEYMKDLEVLKCGSNKLNELNNLPNKIKILNCSHNLITQLNNLPSSIEILDCSYNHLTRLDYLPSSIIKLNCSYNQLTNLDNLACSIEILILNCNPITYLENLPAKLKQLTFNGSIEFKNKILNPPANLEKVIILNSTYPKSVNYINYSNIIKKKKIYRNKTNFDNLIKLPKINTLNINVNGGTLGILYKK